MVLVMVSVFVEQPLAKVVGLLITLDFVKTPFTLNLNLEFSVNA